MSAVDSKLAVSAAQMPLEEGLLFTALAVEVAQALKDPRRALAPVLCHVPGWTEAAAAVAECSQVSGAMTNLVYRVHSPLAASPATATAIVRVFGRGAKLFSRRQERGIFLAASRTGLGPRCLVEFANGRVEEFLPGAALTAASMRQPGVAAAIAAALAEFHVTMFEALPLVRSASGAADGGGGLEGGSPQADIGGECSALWRRLLEWLEAARRVAPAECRALGLEAAAEELAVMEAACERRWGHVPLLACCHNDLQYGNVLLQHHSAPEPAPRSRGRLPEPVARLIDYEYCAVGDVAMDIANHFCEYAADYHCGRARVLDWARLPSEAQAELFCRAYASALLQRFGSSSLADALRRSAAAAGTPSSSASAASGGDDVEGAAQVLRRRAAAFVPLSHLMWGIWGVIQAKLSEVEFDYAAYAEQRLEQYHVTKAAMLHA